ncbi:hypothetical protein RFI_21176, partial [Reticulomyxa filosa]
NLEIVFTSFSWLFKFLHRYMTIVDLQKFYKKYFAQILANRHYYVRDFMAEVLGSIVRSVQDPKEQFALLKHDIMCSHVRKHLFTNILPNSKRNQEAFSIGLAVFLFQCCRVCYMLYSINKSFNTQTVQFVPNVLRVLKCEKREEWEQGNATWNEESELDYQTKVIREFIDLSAVFTNRNQGLRFFAPLFKEVIHHLDDMHATFDRASKTTHAAVGCFFDDDAQ